MARADSLAKLAFAYGLHLTRRRLERPRSQLAKLLETYAPDGIRPLLPEERERHPHLIGCINCGLCALAAGRVESVRLPELASSYRRLYARLGEAASDVEGESPDIEAAASACPVGGPLVEGAAILRRVAGGLNHRGLGPIRQALIPILITGGAKGCELPTFCIQSVEITQHLAPMVKTLLRPL